MFSLSTVVVSGKCSPLPVIGLADRFWALEDALVGSEESIRYPKHSDKLDCEIDALVIGKRARRVSVGEAMEHVAGYSVALDLTVRDWQRDPRHMVKFDLFSGKVFDDSCPMGPGIVPARYVGW